jgi:hypothetical protein
MVLNIIYNALRLVNFQVPQEPPPLPSQYEAAIQAPKSKAVAGDSTTIETR